MGKVLKKYKKHFSMVSFEDLNVLYIKIEEKNTTISAFSSTQ